MENSTEDGDGWMIAKGRTPAQAPPDAQPPQETTAMPWRGWFLRGLGCAGVVAVSVWTDPIWPKTFSPS